MYRGRPPRGTPRPPWVASTPPSPTPSRPTSPLTAKPSRVPRPAPRADASSPPLSPPTTRASPRVAPSCAPTRARAPRGPSTSPAAAAAASARARFGRFGVAASASTLVRRGSVFTGERIFVFVIANRPACGRFRRCTSAEYRAPSYPPKASNAAPPPTATIPAPSAASDDPASTSAALVHSNSPSTADTLSATVSLRPPSAPPPPVMYQASPTTAPAAYARGTGGGAGGMDGSPRHRHRVENEEFPGYLPRETSRDAAEHEDVGHGAGARAEARGDVSRARGGRRAGERRIGSRPPHRLQIDDVDVVEEPSSAVLPAEHDDLGAVRAANERGAVASSGEGRGVRGAFEGKTRPLHRLRLEHPRVGASVLARVADVSAHDDDLRAPHHRRVSRARGELVLALLRFRLRAAPRHRRKVEHVRVGQTTTGRVAADDEDLVADGGDGVRVSPARELTGDLGGNVRPDAVLRDDSVDRGVRARRRGGGGGGGCRLGSRPSLRIRAGADSGGGDRVGRHLEHLRHALRVAAVGDEVVPVGILLLHGRHVHLHGVDRGRVAQLGPRTPLGALDGVPSPRFSGATRTGGHLEGREERGGSGFRRSSRWTTPGDADLRRDAERYAPTRINIEGDASEVRGRTHLLVERVEQEAGLVGDGTRAQRRVRREPDRGVEAVGEGDSVRHRPRRRSQLDRRRRLSFASGSRRRHGARDRRGGFETRARWATRTRR